MDEMKMNVEFLSRPKCHTKNVRPSGNFAYRYSP